MSIKSHFEQLHKVITPSKNEIQNFYLKNPLQNCSLKKCISKLLFQQYNNWGYQQYNNWGHIFFSQKNINRKKHKFKFKTNQKFFNDSTRMLKLPWKYFSYQIGKFFHFLLIAQLISNLSPPEKFFSAQLII